MACGVKVNGSKVWAFPRRHPGYLTSQLSNVPDMMPPPATADHQAFLDNPLREVGPMVHLTTNGDWQTKADGRFEAHRRDHFEEIYDVKKMKNETNKFKKHRKNGKNGREPLTPIRNCGSYGIWRRPYQVPCRLWRGHGHSVKPAPAPQKRNKYGNTILTTRHFLHATGTVHSSTFQEGRWCILCKPICSNKAILHFLR